MTEVFGTPRSGTGTPTRFLSPGVSSPGVSSRRLSGVGTPSTLAKKNEAQELRDRRRSKVIELQNRHLSSPTTPTKSSPKTTSNPLKGLSISQLSDHYANCVKLNAENKITVKNAFGLHLIDYMTDLLKGKKLGDFQVAGTTLDASAKIYASRVDAIHSETYKVLGTLSRGNKKKDNDGNEEGDGDDGFGDDDSPEVEGKKSTRKKKRRNKFIETNLKNITVEKFEFDFEMDPLFKSLTQSFSEGLSSGLLLSALSCYTDRCELVLDSTSIIEDIEKEQCSDTFKNPVDIGEIKDHLEKTNFSKAQICPTFSKFKFNDWNEEDDTMQIGGKHNSDYAFDIDAEPENIPEGEGNDFDVDGGFDDNDGEDSNEETVGIVGNDQSGGGEHITAASDPSRLLKTTLTTISSTSSMVNFLAATPSEYSFFNKKLLQTWKGPTHWKICPAARMKKQTSENKIVTKKAKFLLDFSEKRDFDAQFKKARSCQLTKRKLDQWDQESSTLPKDLDYKASDLFACFLRKCIMVRRQLCGSVFDDELVGDYDYNNCNDKENYCPAYGQDGGDNDDDDDIFGFSCITNSSQQSCGNVSGESGVDPTKLSMLDGDGLVAQPHKVAKINISYAKTAKKVDMRRLKESLWKLLSSPPAGNKENENQNSKAESENDENVDLMKETALFSDIMIQLPGCVPSFMANNVSVPIAFVCLLHLANEKGLHLTNIEMRDIEIMQPIATS